MLNKIKAEFSIASHNQKISKVLYDQIAPKAKPTNKWNVIFCLTSIITDVIHSKRNMCVALSNTISIEPDIISNRSLRLTLA